MTVRLAMAGAVEFSRECLSSLLRIHAPLVGVISLPPRLAGRHADYADLAPTALGAGLESVASGDVNGPEVLAALRRWAPDVLLVLGWSQLLKGPLLAAPRLGTIGSHPALLPKNRGRHPVIWQIINGEKESGLTLFWLDESADRGPLFLQERFPLDADEDAGTFYAKMTRVAVNMMPEVVRLLESGNPPRLPQDDSQATSLRKRSEQDGWIDWTRPASEIHALVRALTHPYPGATSFFGEQPVVLWKSRVAPGIPAPPGTLLELPEKGRGVATG